MAKYATSLRDARMQTLLTALRGTKLSFCSGTMPTTLAVPAAASVVSEHQISTTGGTVNAGVLTLATNDVGQDTAANNAGTITWAVFVNGTNPIAAYAVPTQAAVQLNGQSTLAVSAGTPVSVSSFTVTEGNS